MGETKGVLTPEKGSELLAWAKGPQGYMGELDSHHSALPVRTTGFRLLCVTGLGKLPKCMPPGSPHHFLDCPTTP